jgi:hypothetical protein
MNMFAASYAYLPLQNCRPQVLAITNYSHAPCFAEGRTKRKMMANQITVSSTIKCKIEKLLFAT